MKNETEARSVSCGPVVCHWAFRMGELYISENEIQIAFQQFL